MLAEDAIKAAVKDLKAKVTADPQLSGDDVDNQPLIDKALFAPLHAAIAPLDTRNQVSQANALNMIARDFGVAGLGNGAGFYRSCVCGNGIQYLDD